MPVKIELPEFDEYFELSNKIKQVSLEVAKIKLNLQSKESDIIREATQDSKYFINGKPPSMDYLKRVYAYSGLNGELIPIREELLEKEEELDDLKRRYDILKIVSGIWRTQSANERSALS